MPATLSKYHPHGRLGAQGFARSAHCPLGLRPFAFCAEVWTIKTGRESKVEAWIDQIVEGVPA